MNFLKRFFIVLSLFLFLANFFLVQAQLGRVFEARVVKILDQSSNKIEGVASVNQRLEVLIVSGELKTKQILADNQGGADSSRVYKPGDEVIVAELILNDNSKQYLVLDYSRKNALIFIFLIFIAVVLLVARKKGVFSLIGLLASVIFIIYFFLPQLSKGSNPFLVSVLSVFFILCFVFPLSHGFNKKTLTAGLATFLSLLITMLLAEYFIRIANISGLSDESAVFLQASNPELFNIKGIFTASVLIGCLGVLDDVSISQVSVVEELMSKTKSSLEETFKSALIIGKDHITSLVNTLFFVYISSSLPMFILFYNSEQSLFLLINNEFIVEDIVRSLTASIGLILSVPITTLLSVVIYSKSSH
ncbi:MAG: hypothetical protein KatS3mg091_548 [Patescibacteria group bacterium]|nr:MAG: hypothetical protein KatS3mg091_548 [Patescibacteria group bacterium]